MRSAPRGALWSSFVGPAELSDFDANYVGTPPWDIGRPQTAIQRLADRGFIRGRVLDVGCGTGEHALMAAELGLEAWGVDASPRAIKLAREKASDRGLAADFHEWDALDLQALGERFDTVVDSGLFHIFERDERGRFVKSLRRAVAPGGRYVMLCFSHSVGWDSGP